MGDVEVDSKGWVDNKGERINGLDLVCELVNYIIYAILLSSFKISS